MFVLLLYCRAVISLPLHKGAFDSCVPKVRLLFLTSTAFVDTKAKHILIEWTNSQIYDIIIKKFQPFSKSVSIWVKAFNEVQTSEQTRCRKNHN